LKEEPELHPRGGQNAQRSTTVWNNGKKRHLGGLKIKEFLQGEPWKGSLKEANEEVGVKSWAPQPGRGNNRST